MTGPAQPCGGHLRNLAEVPAQPCGPGPLLSFYILTTLPNKGGRMGKMGQFPACYAVHQLGGRWEILASR